MNPEIQKVGSQLWRAAKSNDVSTIVSCLDALPEAISYRFLGKQAHHWAGMGGSLESLIALVERGAAIDEPAGDDFETPLTGAARYGHAEVVDWLLARGAKVDGWPSTDCSPLTAAAIEGQLGTVRLLVDAGADLLWEGKRPATPLDWATLYQVRGPGQKEVASFLESRGALRPFAEWHNWSEPEVELIERNVGVVHPLPASRTVGLLSLPIYRARFTPNKFLSQLLFTGSLHAGFEVGLVLPAEWRTNKNALTEQRFGWPYELLSRIADVVRGGAKLAHGDVLQPGDTILGGDEYPVFNWLVVNSELVESKRKDIPGTAPLLLLTPITTKKIFKAGREGIAEADKRAKWKWERLHLPLPDMTPAGYDAASLKDAKGLGFAPRREAGSNARTANDERSPDRFK